MGKLNILFLVKPFGDVLAKHKPKFDFIKSVQEYANVHYWYKDGHLPNILSQINFRPDFIYHYDIAYNYALSPKITGLHLVDIPKGCFVNDVQVKKEFRKAYIEQNKIDLIFSSTKYPFLQVYKEYEDKFRWLPWSINPSVIKDWQKKKDIDFLLMGQVYHENKKLNRARTPKGIYPFREAVLQKMRNEKGFVHHPHPGHRVEFSKELLVQEKYSRELNRAKIFFTCGSVLKYGVFKFLEAPGCRTLLLAEPNRDILELGFKDGVNFVACSTSDFYEKSQYYIKNKKERQRITDNGYNLIQTNHTNKVRAQEFVNHISIFLKAAKERSD